MRITVAFFYLSACNSVEISSRESSHTTNGVHSNVNNFFGVNADDDTRLQTIPEKTDMSKRGSSHAYMTASTVPQVRRCGVPRRGFYNSFHNASLPRFTP